MKILVEGASKRSIHRDYGIGDQALGAHLATVEQILADDKEAPPKRRHTTRRIFERLRADRAEYGYTGCYSQVQTAVKNAGRRSSRSRSHPTMPSSISARPGRDRWSAVQGRTRGDHAALSDTYFLSTY